MSTSGTENDLRASRVRRLAGEMAALELDALMVDSLVDVSYLTGFTGSHAMALVVADSARQELGPDRFLTDFRYDTQSAEQVLDVFQREIVTGDLLDALAQALSERTGRLGFDDASLSVKGHGHLAELLGEGWSSSLRAARSSACAL